ncbi:MAG: hypothetical protein U7126_15915 [Microcoleus sp.]
MVKPALVGCVAARKAILVADCRWRRTLRYRVWCVAARKAILVADCRYGIGYGASLSEKRF